MNCKCILCLTEPANCPVLTNYQMCNCTKGTFMCRLCAVDFFRKPNSKCLICKAPITYSQWKLPYIHCFGLWTAVNMNQECTLCNAKFDNAYSLYDHQCNECPQSLVLCPSGHEPQPIPRYMLQEHIRTCSFFLYQCKTCKKIHNRYFKDGCPDEHIDEPRLPDWQHTWHRDVIISDFENIIEAISRTQE